jgi:hypothetical protein
MRTTFTFVRNIVLVIAAAALLTACNRVKPIYEVRNQPIPQLSAPLTLGQVEKGILSAGAKIGWKMIAVKPGLVHGTIQWQRHSGTVGITYDTRSFSMLYERSYRLKYGMGMEDTTYEGKRVIHNRYNQHVK